MATAATAKIAFKADHTLEYRTAEANKIKTKYPDRVPVIVERVTNSQITQIDKRKYLVPNDITVAQFMWIIRKRISMPPEKALFLFVNKVVPTSAMTMGEIYQEHRDEDGFLYIQYSGENTFGCDGDCLGGDCCFGGDC